MSYYPGGRPDLLKAPPASACAFYGYNSSWFSIQHQSNGPFSCSLHFLEYLNHPNTVATATSCNQFTFATLPTSIQLHEFNRDQVHSHSTAISHGTGRKVVRATLVEKPRPTVVAPLVPAGANGTHETEPAHLNLASDGATQRVDQYTEECLQQNEENSLEQALVTDHSHVDSALQQLTIVAEQVLTEEKVCQLCGTHHSPKWRINGRFCNSCGLKHMRSPDYEPQKRSRDANFAKLCEICGTDDTPKWRYNGTLCNACGLKKMRKA